MQGLTESHWHLPVPMASFTSHNLPIVEAHGFNLSAHLSILFNARPRMSHSSIYCVCLPDNLRDSRAQSPSPYLTLSG